MTTYPHRPPPGLTVGGYELLARLGEGGMGVVHLARQPGGERIALKVLRPHIVGDDEARHRLAREVSSLARVRSRRVAEIIDADPWGEIPFVATRYVPGLSLHDHVHEEGPITGSDLPWFATCLAEALAAVHSVGVLHRDIKPSNILMEGRSPVLIDFGLARVADDPKLTHTGWLLGTPGYLAPEILYGEDATAASDVHSWATTVAFAGTGLSPFGRGPSMAIMDRVRRGEYDLAGLDPLVRPLIEACLTPDPRRRPTLQQVQDSLSTRPSAPRVSPLREDPFTLPLAVAALAHTQTPTRVGEAAAPTAHQSPAPPHVEPYVEPYVEPGVGHSAYVDLHTDPRVEPPVDPHADPYTDPRAHQYVDRDSRPMPVAGPRRTAVMAQHTGVLPDGITRALPPGPPAAHRPASGGERLRRAVFVVAGLLGVAGAVAWAPYLAVTALALLAWLLRSGTLAAEAVGVRRVTRGQKWYDGPRTLVVAPWHAFRALPGTLLLVGWSVGLGCASALIGYAFSASGSTTLLTAGLAFAVGMWWGPCSDRVRTPVTRLTRALSVEPMPWLVAALFALAVGFGTVAGAMAYPTNWGPASDRPFAGFELPGFLQP